MSFINQTVSNGLFKIVTENPTSKLSIWGVSERTNFRLHDNFI